MGRTSVPGGRGTSPILTRTTNLAYAPLSSQLAVIYVPFVRWTAARVLGDMQSEAAIPALLIAAQEKNPRVRSEATESIEFIRFGIGDH